MAWNTNEFIETLYIEEFEKLVKTAYRLTNDQEMAQDLVHETFILAIFHQQKLKDHPKPGAWLLITLRNLIFNEFRSKSHEDMPLDAAIHIPQKTAAPLEDLLPVQLHAEEREILIWRFEQQVSYREMSERLGVSETRCRKRVSRAVAKCRKLLKENKS